MSPAPLELWGWIVAVAAFLIGFLVYVKPAPPQPRDPRGPRT
jgi:hypothetical protein